MKSFLLFCVLFIAVAVVAASIDITGDPPYQSASARTNDVIHIALPSGARAVIQFTSFDGQRASYRWRFRALPASTVQTGTGVVKESYDSKPGADGRRHITPKSDHDTVVRAGDVRMEWSFGSATNGWIYFHTNRATVRVLDASVFERDL